MSEATAPHLQPLEPLSADEIARPWMAAGVVLSTVCLLVLACGEAAAELDDAGRAAALATGKASVALADSLRSAAAVDALVVFEQGPGGGAGAARANVEALGDAVLARLSPGDFVVSRRFASFGVLSGRVSGRGLLALIADANVLAVELDGGGRGHLAQAVPLVELDAVQASGFTGSGIQVAVLDSGFDPSHPDVADAVLAEACFCSGGGGCCPGGGSSELGPGSAEDDHGHGTNVTGVLTSDGDVAPTGGAPDVEIVAVKVLDSSNAFCCASDVLAGLDWILQERPEVDVVNLSLGTFAIYEGECDENGQALAWAAAVDALRANGVLAVASSGNDGSATQMSAPACVGAAISVAAVWDQDVGSQTVLGCTDSSTGADQVTCFSNTNASTDLAAPGAPTTSAGLGGGTSTFYGTSQAAPLVASCAATLLEASPGLSPDDLEGLLEATGVTVTDAKQGVELPRIDCAAARGALPAPPGLPVTALGGAGASALAALLAACGVRSRRA